jgi:hypothetical protein
MFEVIKFVLVIKGLDKRILCMGGVSGWLHDDIIMRNFPHGCVDAYLAE